MSVIGNGIASVKKNAPNVTLEDTWEGVFRIFAVENPLRCVDSDRMVVNDVVIIGVGCHVVDFQSKYKGSFPLTWILRKGWT